MDEEHVLTVSELAKRWKCDDDSIRRYERNGRIKRAEDIPGVKFSVSLIEQIENKWDDPLSPLERRRLEKTIENKDKIIAELQEKLLKIKNTVLEV